MPQVFNGPPRWPLVEVWPNSKRASSLIGPITLRALFMISIILIQLSSDLIANIGQLLLAPSSPHYRYHHHNTNDRHYNRPLCAGLVSALGQVQPVNANQLNSSSSRPHWHRPGCYQVGHTRTISIPGCVKFNLSTNACRGFCMSFSIPVAEDIGSSISQLSRPASSPTGSDTAAAAAATPAISLNNQLLAALNEEHIGGQQQQPADYALLQSERVSEAKRRQYLDNAAAGGIGGVLLRTINKRQVLLAENGAGTGTNQPLSASSLASDKQYQEFLHLTGQTRSPLAGAVGDTGEKRDVISVGQCCNMMETEDVTVNLRCGFNETRRLVFKSAKTCECFFCKHL